MAPLGSVAVPMIVPPLPVAWFIGSPDRPKVMRQKAKLTNKTGLDVRYNDCSSITDMPKKEKTRELGARRFPRASERGIIGEEREGSARAEAVRNPTSLLPECQVDRKQPGPTCLHQRRWLQLLLSHHSRDKSDRLHPEPTHVYVQCPRKT